VLVHVDRQQSKIYFKPKSNFLQRQQALHEANAQVTIFSEKYFAYDLDFLYDSVTLDILHCLMSISFLVYFFGYLVKVMRYVGKASITQEVIPRCTRIERA
jgi:hypothetical protein